MNHQFRQFLDGLAPPDTGLQLPYHDNNTTQQKPCPEPQPEFAMQYVLPQEPPPAPNPTDRPPQPLTQWHASQFDSSMCINQIFVHCIPPLTPTQPCGSHQTNPTQTTIPNWAKHAVPTHATNPMTSLFSTSNPHWPPPWLAWKTIPFKKKLQTKPTIPTQKQEKDSLHLP